jgi:SagB-type dehydrogenase family enzyme
MPAPPAPVAGGLVRLPLPAERGRLSLEEALAQRRSRRDFGDRPLTLAEVGQLLWAAQGVTAPWRGFRTAPSAGATYPLEVDVVVGEGTVTGLAAGVYRYQPAGHRLETRAPGDRRAGLAAAALGQPWVRAAPVTIAIAAVYGRTTARYGERGHRYVYLEAGHVGQNVQLQAVSLGLGSVTVGAFRDTQVARLLGLSPEEVPVYLLPVGSP